jgi:hypothetical protein
MPAEPDFIVYYQNAHLIGREQVLPPSTTFAEGAAAVLRPIKRTKAVVRRERAKVTALLLMANAFSA